MMEKKFTRVASQSWCMVVSTVVKIQRVPVMLSGKTHNLYLEREKKKKTEVILRFFFKLSLLKFPRLLWNCIWYNVQQFIKLKLRELKPTHTVFNLNASQNNLLRRSSFKNNYHSTFKSKAGRKRIKLIYKHFEVPVISRDCTLCKRHLCLCICPW